MSAYQISSRLQDEARKNGLMLKADVVFNQVANCIDLLMTVTDLCGKQVTRWFIGDWDAGEETRYVPWLLNEAKAKLRRGY